MIKDLLKEDDGRTKIGACRSHSLKPAPVDNCRGCLAAAQAASFEKLLQNVQNVQNVQILQNVQNVQ